MPYISILITAYNVERWLPAALSSAVGQTLQDIEVVCVDDGSTDDTPRILAQHAAKDPRVRLVRHSENLGRHAARRTGVLAAAGEYLIFLDGDDYLSPETCQRLYSAMCGDPVDVLQFGAQAFAEAGSGVDERELHSYDQVLRPWLETLPDQDYALLQACFVQRKISHSLCNKMFPTRLLQRVYTECPALRLNMAEDLMASFFIGSMARSYRGLPDTLYHYRLGSGISTRQTQMLTEAQVGAFAQEYQVCTLLRERFGASPSRELQQALRCVCDTVVQDVLHAFFHRTAVADRPAFLRQLVQVYPTQLFLTDVAARCDTPGWPSAAEAVSALRGMPCPAPDRIKTVGSFYHRLYNGGVERVITLLADIWQQAGYRVVIFTDQKKTDRDYPLPAGVQRVVLPHAKTDAERVACWHRLLQKYDVDLMVYHAWVDRRLPLDSLAVKAAGIPFVVHTHGQASCAFPWGVQELTDQRMGYALSDAVVTLTAADDAWWSALGFRSMRTFNPMTYTTDQAPPSPLAGHTALWVGRLSAEKRLGDALAIARLVREQIPDFRLRVIGGAETPELWQEVRDSVARAGLQDAVCLEGFHTDVSPFYADAAVMLSTSEQEGWGMTLVESQVFGLPLVSYELPNIDLLRAGKGVLVVPQGDICGAAGHIVRLLRDSALRAEAGAAARASAERLSAVDLGMHWRGIFDEAAKPTPPFAPLIEQTPLEASICMAMRRVAACGPSRAPAADGSDLAGELERLRRQNAQYAVMVDQLTHSTIFRVGRIVTWPGRKLKKLLRKG